mmetsp:Transcript_35699/g.89002  ORF Transcript_35699/g.89002 Transcript_35699/m.89002 type:complete len:490 (+) Transcript_35699:1755-3224(+)
MVAIGRRGILLLQIRKVFTRAPVWRVEISRTIFPRQNWRVGSWPIFEGAQRLDAPSRRGRRRGATLSQSARGLWPRGVLHLGPDPQPRRSTRQRRAGRRTHRQYYRRSARAGVVVRRAPLRRLHNSLLAGRGMARARQPRDARTAAAGRAGRRRPREPAQGAHLWLGARRQARLPIRRCVGARPRVHRAVRRAFRGPPQLPRARRAACALAHRRLDRVRQPGRHAPDPPRQRGPGPLGLRQDAALRQRGGVQGLGADGRRAPRVAAPARRALGARGARCAASACQAGHRRACAHELGRAVAHLRRGPELGACGPRQPAVARPSQGAAGAARPLPLAHLRADAARDPGGGPGGALFRQLRFGRVPGGPERRARRRRDLVAAPRLCVRAHGGVRHGLALLLVPGRRAARHPRALAHEAPAPLAALLLLRLLALSPLRPLAQRARARQAAPARPLRHARDSPLRERAELPPGLRCGRLPRSAARAEPLRPAN